MALRFETSTDAEEWLKKHTISCPLGRLTRKQCEMNRGRPTPADHFKIVPGRHMSSAKASAVVFRPGACEKCTQWKENQTPEIGVDMAAKKCTECGEEKRIIGRGLCGKCYWRLPDVKEKANARSWAKRAAKKLAASGSQQAVTPLEQSSAAGGGRSPQKQAGADLRILQIDFSGCPEVLAKIEELAAAQDRNPDQQARFLLRGAVGLTCTN